MGGTGARAGLTARKLIGQAHSLWGLVALRAEARAPGSIPQA